MPEISTTLITDQNKNIETFDNIIQLSNPRKDFGDQVFNIDRTPYDKTIFLDTDIYLTDSIREIFTLLDEFDIAAAQNFTNFSSKRIEWDKLLKVPQSFPEYNSGVVAFESNNRTKDFFQGWKDAYKEVVSRGQIHNQAAFRLALYYSNVRIATLPTSYNCRFRKSGSVSGKIKVFHGRLLDIDSPGAGLQVDVEQAIKELNRTERNRSYYTIGNSVRLAEPNILLQGYFSLRDRGILSTLNRLRDKYL